MARGSSAGEIISPATSPLNDETMESTTARHFAARRRDTALPAARPGDLTDLDYDTTQETKKMTSLSTIAKVNNGVNVTALLGARESLQQVPEAAQFKW